LKNLDSEVKGTN